MGRTGVRRRRLALTVLTLALCGLLIGPVAHGLTASAAPRRQPVRVWVVRSGDTLWQIARQVAPSEDPRAVVDRIATANPIAKSGIVPGQSLVVPLSP